jgi:hypothetical protein
MKHRTIIKLALIWNGNYDIPGESLKIKGFDMYGNEMEEEIPKIDTKRLESDVDAAMKGLADSE